MEIPFNSAVRPDTGTTNSRLGMWLFLASEVMLFGALFSAYTLLRVGAASWPDQSAVLSVPLGALNSVVLIASSLTIALATKAIQRADPKRYRVLMGLTVFLGVAFLAVKGAEYSDKWSQGLTPATNNFLGLYYTLTGIHAAHLLAGVVVNLYLMGPGLRMSGIDQSRFLQRVQIAALYWQFVDVVWLALFVVLYLL